MQVVLRYLALLLAVITFAFAAASLYVAVVDANDRGAMLVGSTLLIGIGAFFVWRFRSLRR